jgi:hypothetical protein
MELKEEGGKGIEKITVEAPWTDGEVDVTFGLGMIRTSAAQLIWYLETGQSPNPDFTKRDLDALKLIIEKNDEQLALDYMRTKHEAIRAGKRFEDNFAVLKHLGVDCDAK